VYYGLKVGGGLAAIRIADGQRLWQVPIVTGGSEKRVGYDSPATALPGVIFLGGSDGSIVAASSLDGHLLWSYQTNRAFDTVNRVPAHGGAMGSQGVTVVGGMLFAGSGYSVGQSGVAHSGNVVLAFAPR
jgi:polyvinyl alcohol dehydrogenase (cytochrome)